MNQLGVPRRLIQSDVRISKKASEPFSTTKGFRQGEALSCVLFNICLEIVIRVGVQASNNNMLYKSFQLLGYADDIDIIARKENDMAASFINIRNAAEGIGLRVNVEKTKYMKSSRENPATQNIKTGPMRSRRYRISRT